MHTVSVLSCLRFDPATDACWPALPEGRACLKSDCALQMPLGQTHLTPPLLVRGPNTPTSTSSHALLGGDERETKPARGMWC
jgi:hypothetical protein